MKSSLINWVYVILGFHRDVEIFLNMQEGQNQEFDKYCSQSNNIYVVYFSPNEIMPVKAGCITIFSITDKGVYRVSIVKRPLLSTLPYLVAFYNFIK